MRFSVRVLVVLCLSGSVLVWPSRSRGEGLHPLHFTDVSREAGITRVVYAGRPGKDHLLDSAGNGIAWLDFDEDGYLDVYVVNGWKLSGRDVVEKGRNALYRNRGDGTFEDVTDRAGVWGEGRWGSGVAVADYDGDGWPDILVTNFGPNVLYRNRGDRTFENVAAQAGIEAPGWNTGAAFLDADGDGDLDLYVAAYIECTMDEVLDAKRTLEWKGKEKVAVGPFGLQGARDHFFLSDGKGHFVDATAESGLEDRSRGYGFAVRAADLDGDGDLDIYVANDSDANYLYRNDGKGRFEEVGLWTGAAFGGGGAAQAGMGVEVGDIEGDGNLDIFVTNFSEDFSTLYRGTGGGFFEDVSEKTGVGDPTYIPMSWGAALADLDDDGDLDLAVANGHIYPQVDDVPDSLTYRQRNLLFENEGGGHFEDVTGNAGPGFSVVESSRGLSAGDYDNDGDLDLLVSNLDQPPSLLRNDSAGGHWLTVVCEAPPGQGPLIGTRVIVTAGRTTMVRDIASSASYLSVHDPRPHFGLGAAQSVNRVEVRWPDGTRTVRENVSANQFLRIVKGSDEPRP
jgi:enediyne biosynthesis protein E4